MKGIVFTEFLDMVEGVWGYEMVDEIIEKSELKSEGIYTSVGTYEYSEMVQLLTHLSKSSGKDLPFLLNAYGKYLFETFKKNYPTFFSSAPDLFSFLESIDEHIHVEVLKLYPDAELPKFDTERKGDQVLEMIYKSERRMADFAEGLLEKTIEHYQETCTMEKVKLNDSGSEVKFIITKK